jgi:outer membrane protein assembly factor BamA
MNKVLLTAAAAAALSFASFSAAAATKDGFFINVSGGNAHYDVKNSSGFDKSDKAFGGVAGYRWVVDRPFSIGVEAGYVDLGKMTYTDDYRDDYYNYSDSYQAKYKGKALLVGMNGKWDLPNNLTITARLGVAHTRTSASVNYYVHDDGRDYSYNLGRAHDTDNGIYAGLGFGYDFSQHFGITLTYDHYAFKAGSAINDESTVNVGVFGAAAEFRF